VRGLLYVGTDDGQVRVSRDSGATFADVGARVPGLPARSWINGFEPSPHADGTVFMTVDNHRSDDFANYVYRSTDFGQTWTSIAGDLPAGRVARTIRQDRKNASLLYLGTDLGLYVSLDAGAHWMSLRLNMPTLAINDLVIHPRDNALVLATHGRGIWILDNVAALQELTPAVAGAASQVFTPQPAEQIRYSNLKAHTGDMIFRGENPQAGAVIDYWLGGQYADQMLSIHDSAGAMVATLSTEVGRGVHQVAWNLRHSNITPDLPAGGRAGRAGAGAAGGRAGGGGGRGGGRGGRGGRGGGGGLQGPLVTPGVYTIRLRAGGRTTETTVEVSEDPRLQISPADRQAWTARQLEIAEVWKRAVAVQAALGANAGRGTAEDRRLAGEVPGRLSGLYGEVGRFTGRPTADQLSQLRYYTEVVERLEAVVR
jgi:hypothetical protein